MEYASAYTVKELIGKLKGFDPDARIIVQEGCPRDFGVDIRYSPDLFCTIELGDKDEWEQESDD